MMASFSRKIRLVKSIAVVIFSNDRQSVLLVKRRDIPVWVLPGGGVEDNEDLWISAEREASEETGLEIVVQRQVALYLPKNRLTKPTALFEASIKNVSEERLQRLYHVNDTAAQSKLQETASLQFFPLISLPSHLVPFYKGWIAQGHKRERCIVARIEQVSYSILAVALIQHPLLVLRFLLTKIGIHINTR